MFHLTTYHGAHEGGTKDYTIFLFHSEATSSSILVKRYGKIGADGQLKIELVRGKGRSEIDKALNERRKNGYDMRHDAQRSLKSADLQDLLKMLPRRHQGALTTAQIKTLDPKSEGFDPLKEQRDAQFAPQFDEERRKREAEATARDAAEFEALSKLPNAGIF